MADVLLDSYACNWTTVRILTGVHPSGDGDVSSEGHCFHHTQAGNYYLKSAKFWLRKYGSPRGFLKAALYAITGTCGSTGKPTGSALAVSTTSLSMATVSSVRPTKYTFDFDGIYELVPNVKYVIQVYAYSVITLDYSHYIGVCYTGSGIDDGNRSYYNIGIWRYGGANQDIPFEVWGEEVPVPAKPLISKPLINPILTNIPSIR